MADTPKSTDPSKSPQATSSESLNRPTPGFGWTAYAEQLNGRFAMIGIVALILIEVLTGHGFIAWLGF